MNTAPFRDQRWLPFRNDAGESIPAYALLRITGVAILNEQTIYSAEKPNASTTHLVWAFNSDLVVASGSTNLGLCTFDFPAIAKTAASANPAINEQWGPKNAEWYIVKNNTATMPLFRIVGKTTGQGDTTVVQQRIDREDLTILFEVASATTGTVKARPPGMTTVPGETGGVVTLVNNLSHHNVVGNLGAAAYVTYDGLSSPDWQVIWLPPSDMARIQIASIGPPLKGTVMDRPFGAVKMKGETGGEIELKNTLAFATSVGKKGFAVYAAGDADKYELVALP